MASLVSSNIKIYSGAKKLKSIGVTLFAHITHVRNNMRKKHIYNYVSFS